MHTEDMEGGEGEEPAEDEEDEGPVGMQVGGLVRGCMHAAGGGSRGGGCMQVDWLDVTRRTCMY